MINISITAEGMDEFIQRLPNDARRHQTLGNVLDQGRQIILRNAMALVNVATGGTRRSGRSEFDPGAPQARVIFGGAAAFLSEGTQPHVIMPRNARLLRFVDPNYGIASGQIGGFSGYTRRTGQAVRGAEELYVFAFSVHHPGTPATHFLARGLDESMPAFQSVMEKELNAIIGGGR